MKISLIIIALTMLAGIVGTLFLAGKGDEDYSRSTKSNLTTLSIIYVALGVLLTIGVGLYIVL